MSHPHSALFSHDSQSSWAHPHAQILVPVTLFLIWFVSHMLKLAHICYYDSISCMSSHCLPCISVMTHSTLGPGPIPKPSQPRTNHQCFIANAPHIALRHLTHSHRTHLYMCVCISWYVQPQWSVQFLTCAVDRQLLYSKRLRWVVGAFGARDWPK